MPRIPKAAPPPPSDGEVALHLAVLQPGEIDGCQRVFSPQRLARLVSEFQLTAPQIYRLAVATRNVAFDLRHSAAPAEVRAALDDVRRHLVAARKKVEQWEKGGAKHSSGREALGHLNLAHQGLGPLPDDGTWPDRIVATELIKLTAVLAERALKIGPPRNLKRPRLRQRANEVASVPASWRAIEWIVEALKMPIDQASQDRAAALPARRTSRTFGAFEHLAALVFATALGVPDDRVNARRSIDAFVRRQTTGGVAQPSVRARKGG